MHTEPAPAVRVAVKIVLSCQSFALLTIVKCDDAAPRTVYGNMWHSQSLKRMSGENTFAMYGSLPMIFFFNINLARGDDARLL